MFIVTYLSFREVKPRVRGTYSLYREESGKESCVTEPAIEGSIEDGSITQQSSPYAASHMVGECKSKLSGKRRAWCIGWGCAGNSNRVTRASDAASRAVHVVGSLHAGAMENSYFGEGVWGERANLGFSHR